MLHNSEFWDDLAIESYRAILKTKPDSAIVHKNLGLAYMRRGRDNKAVRSFQRAVKCDVNFAEAYYHLGTACNRLGRSKEAVRSLKHYKRLMDEAKGTSPVVSDLLEQLKSESKS